MHKASGSYWARLAEIGQDAFVRFFLSRTGRCLILKALWAKRDVLICRFYGVSCGANKGIYSLISDILHSRNADSVRRVTLHAQLIDCACKRGLLDFVLAHGEPVLCRYA